MKKIFLITLTLIITIRSNSQEKKHIYVDENYKEISLKEYRKKVQSKLFFAAIIENDTAIFKKVRYKEFFGNLNVNKKSQLNRLFYKRYNVDSTKVWLIQYKNILRQDTLGKAKYKSSYSNTLRAIDRLKRTEDISLLFFYRFSKNPPIERNNIKWYRDNNSILKNIFTDGMKAYEYIVVYPNGNFYLLSHSKLFFSNKKLLKPKAFKELEEKWRKRIEKYN